MEFEINDVPFEMAEISPKLFNLQFLSDITFVIDGKQIYAHSLELMKRSVVFQNQLEPTIGEKMLIPITDYGFDVFYQFIRFIYTDECLISETNCYELLKLAKDYKVIRLFNVVQNSNCSKYLTLLDFCIVENHQIALNYVKTVVASNLHYYLKKTEFLSVHPQTVEEILKFDQIGNAESELDIIDALIHWMKQHCIQNQIQFSECRNKFEKLICLIRFPTLSNEELLDVNTKYPDLLTISDLSDIAIQKVFGVKREDRIWNDAPRMKLEWPYELKMFPSDKRLETKFTVATEMILGGFISGMNYKTLNNVFITISRQNSVLRAKPETPLNIKIFRDDTRFNKLTLLINLGLSIRVRPGFTYTIAYKYSRENFPANVEMKYRCRKPQTEFIINAPPNSVKMLQTHETMQEIMFLQPDSQNRLINEKLE